MAGREQELVDYSGGGSGRDSRLSAGYSFEHRAELRCLEVLQQIALCSGLYRSEEIGLVLADREHHDGDLGVARLDFGRRFEAGDVGHPDVHQNDVGCGAVDEIDRLSAVGSLAHDLMTPGQQQRCDSVAE